MAENLIYCLVELKEFILFSVALGLFLSIFFSFYTDVFTWGRTRRTVYGFLLNRTDRELMYAACSILELVFFLSSCIFLKEIRFIHIAFLLVIALWKSLSEFFLITFIRDLINIVLLTLAMAVQNILTGYLRDTGINFLVIFVIIVLSLFLILYSVYFFLCDVENLEKRRENAE